MNTPIHPGEYLKELLIEINMTQSELSKRINVSTMQISHLINKRNRLQPDIALLLGKLFNQSPRYWLNLQMEYDLQVLQPMFQSELDKIVPIEFCLTKGK